ncbi:MAG TPA: Gfo/Idh/MocA family oxidoreductase [Candidatus Hydrogenedentes bacterium]|nr:Gfo/Idh/MocA family oxidoreductase [Candidatus Hydrogenedentota bacterium]HPG65715.1 Gfo/Idh/MocA family oxidoreductase [Candidatus Hydrogenedentota bacterium]
MNTISRRRFLKRATLGLAAGVGPTIIPSSALGADGATAPSERIAVGFVGVGSHGTQVNLRNIGGQPDTEVVAICDVDRKHLEAAVELTKRYYAETRPGVPYGGFVTTGDFREVVERDDIDAVVVSTPDHWHVPVALAAVKAGKDVYCEKPLTLTIREGRVLSDTVKRYGCIFQTGSEFRAQANFHHAAELVRNGRIGELETIWTFLPGGPDKNILDPQPMPVPPELDYDMWLGPAPWAPYHAGRCHYQFRWIQDYSGGQLTDWGGHLNDQAQWGNNTEYTGPITIKGEGVYPPKGLYDTPTDYTVNYRYANGVRLVCTSQPRELAGSIRYEGSEGWIQATYLNGMKAHPASLITSTIGPNEVHLYTCAAGPERNFLDCVRSRRQPYYPAEVGHRSGTIAHLGGIAIRLRRELRWDPANERFVNDAEANRLLSRAMRSPWRI